ASGRWSVRPGRAAAYALGAMAPRRRLRSAAAGKDEFPGRGLLADVGHDLDQTWGIRGEGFGQRASQTARVGDPPGADSERFGIELKVGIAESGAGLASLEQASLIAKHVAV